MFILSSILVYFFSIVIAISAMTFIVLLTMVNEVSKRRQFSFLMSFCACNFLIEILYLCMTIQDSLLHYYHYGMLIRIADTVLYTLQSFSWCRYLLYFPSRNPASDLRSKRLCNILTAVSLILGITSYAFMVNNEFLFTSSLGVIFDLIVSLMLSIMLICTAITRRRLNSTFNRFNLIISCMLILIQWWTSIFMLFESHISFSFEIHEYLGGATQQMLVILALAVYVYKTDYSGVTLRQQLRSLIAKNAADAADSDTHNSSAADYSETAAAVQTADTDMPDGSCIVSQSTDTCMAQASDTCKESSDAGSDTSAFAASDALSTVSAAICGTSHAKSGDFVAADSEDDSLSDIERIFDEKQLTKREREVARLAYTGLTNPEIADKLCISQHTVKRHMHSIFEKLNISARIELVHLMNRM